MSSTMNAPAGSPTLIRTPFYQFHLDHGAKMVDFAGWEMPLLYRSIIDEHRQVRTSGGVFDVSHMGRIRFSGRDARRFLDHVCTRQIAGMSDGQCRYGLICNERGGCRDDVLVYRLADDEYLMVCNASNRLKLLDHFAQVKAGDPNRVEGRLGTPSGGFVFKQADETATTAMIAIQGPKVIELIARFSSEVPALKRYRFVVKSLLMAKFIVSRTGYTGEDGVEVILPASIAGMAVKHLLPDVDAQTAPVKPIGLGARDSLRLEAGMPLYGHEITEELDPLSAGLDFAVKLDKGRDDPAFGGFIGQDALQRISRDGPKRKLVGLILEGRRSARQAMKVLDKGREVGFITSGCLSPTLDQPIAMAYVEAALSEPGTKLQVDLGKAAAEAQVAALPFYKTG